MKKHRSKPSAAKASICDSMLAKVAFEARPVIPLLPSEKEVCTWRADLTTPLAARALVSPVASCGSNAMIGAPASPASTCRREIPLGCPWLPEAGYAAGLRSGGPSGPAVAAL